MEPGEESIAEPLTVLAETEASGADSSYRTKQHNSQAAVGGSNITEIACVQNFYNVARRNDDAFIDDLAVQGIAYVPFFPLEASHRYSRPALDAQRTPLQATPMAGCARLAFSGASRHIL